MTKKTIRTMPQLHPPAAVTVPPSTAAATAPLTVSVRARQAAPAMSAAAPNAMPISSTDTETSGETLIMTNDQRLPEVAQVRPVRVGSWLRFERLTP
ncbi:MAG: hypothetical protein R2845_03815 [Thermomicrobiales bacterium]